MSKNVNAGQCNAVLFGMIYLMFGILLPDAMLRKDVVKDGFGGEEVGAEDEVDAADGTAEVFGD